MVHLVQSGVQVICTFLYSNLYIFVLQTVHRLNPRLNSIVHNLNPFDNNIIIYRTIISTFARIFHSLLTINKWTGLLGHEDYSSSCINRFENLYPNTTFLTLMYTLYNYTILMKKGRTHVSS